MNTSTISPHTTVLNALNAALARVNAITDAEEHKRQMTLLVKGSQTDAKIVGVFNIWRVQEMISRLKHFTCKVPLENGEIAYRFQLPSSYTAFKAYARIDELYEEFHDRIDKLHLLLEVRAYHGEDGAVSFKLHAPRIIPRKTDRVTFILNKEETELVEWFAGELPRSTDHLGHTTGILELGRHWVRLGSYNPPKDGKVKHSKPSAVKPEHHLTTELSDVLDKAQQAAEAVHTAHAQDIQPTPSAEMPQTAQTA